MTTSWHDPSGINQFNGRHQPHVPPVKQDAPTALRLRREGTTATCQGGPALTADDPTGRQYQGDKTNNGIATWHQSKVNQQALAYPGPAPLLSSEMKRQISTPSPLRLVSHTPDACPLSIPHLATRTKAAYGVLVRERERGPYLSCSLTHTHTRARKVPLASLDLARPRRFARDPRPVHICRPISNPGLP